MINKNLYRGVVMKIIFLFLVCLFSLSLFAEQPARPERTIEEQRREIMRFGTETEIASLIQTLRNENVSYLDEDLIEIAQNTRNRAILSGIFGFFGDRGKTGLEGRAIRAILERDEEANETVLAAIDYLGRVNAAEAANYLQELIISGENRFLNNAFRALGRVSRGREGEARSEEQADSIALFLIDYYTNRRPRDEDRREIIVAIGETGSKEAIPFLDELIRNNDERAVLRMAALEAIAKTGDSDKGRDAVLFALTAADPLVRSSAVAALGPFSGEAVDRAILDAFRDSSSGPRIGAAQAAAQRRLESAIPFLRFRVHHDDVPAVRDESIRALGAINNEESMEILEALFFERRHSDRVRLLSAEMLLRNAPDTYSVRIIAEMDEARARNQTPLYNGFVRLFIPVISDTLESFAKRLIATGGVIERTLALDIILNNEFRSLENEVRGLLDERRYGVSVARRAQSTLERLGLDLVVQAESN